MARIIIGAVIAFCAGSGVLAALHALDPGGPNWGAREMLMVVLFGGAPLAPLGAVMGAVPRIVNVLASDVGHYRSPTRWAILGAGAGFIWGSVSLILLWGAFLNDVWRWEVFTYIVFLGGGPFATIGALLGATSAIQRGARERERAEQIRHLHDSSFEPDDLAPKS
jgi:MFS family permease